MRRLLASCAFVLMALALAAPAQAKASDDRVVIEGPVTIGPREVAGDVVVAHGDVTVAGRLTGDLVVASGKVRVDGSVHGDVVGIADRVVLGSHARVGGDVQYADKKPVVPAGARVGGDVKRVNFGKATGGLGLAVGFGIWLAVTISAFLLGALLLWVFPRAAGAVYEVAESRVGAAVGFGLLAFFALPVVRGIHLLTLFRRPPRPLPLLAHGPRSPAPDTPRPL